MQKKIMIFLFAYLGQNWTVWSRRIKMGPTGSSVKCPLPSMHKLSSPCKSNFVLSPSQAHLRCLKYF